MTEHRTPEQQFPEHHCRNESLREMSYAVVIVPCEPELIAQPAEERHFGVCVMTTDHQDERVETEQYIDECGKAEAPIGNEHNNKSDQRGDRFKEPREKILRSNHGPDESGREKPEKEEMFLRNR